MSKQREIIQVAFACDPNYGSEKGIGWLAVKAASRRYRVHVITPSENRKAIEEVRKAGKINGVCFHYVDLPGWLRPLRKRNYQLYYLLWQFASYWTARQVVRERPIALIHHVTYGNAWTPVWLGHLKVPFVWNAGGRAPTPVSFIDAMSLQGRRSERLRNAVLWLTEPFVNWITASTATVIHTCSEQSLWSSDLPVRRFILGGLAKEELKELRAMGARSSTQKNSFRIMSIGRLLPWKGFDLGIRAFAQIRQAIPGAEYWIIGDGSERDHLERLADDLGCEHAVRFWGRLPRDETLSHLAKADVLVHPSLHEQFGYVLLEAMALGVPPICLDAEGAPKVVGKAGKVIDLQGPEYVVRHVSRALRDWALHPERRRARAQKGKNQAMKWTHERVGNRLLRLYGEVMERGGGPEPG